MSYLPSVEYTLDETIPGSFEPKEPLNESGDAGFDLYAASAINIRPGESVLVRTGIRMAIPKGWVGIISPRSSVASQRRLRVGARIIDSTYRNEVLINLHNDGVETQLVEMGVRIVQIVFTQHLSKMSRVKSLSQSTRGGFGSTGER